LKLGYRHIDTAQCYQNEDDVGRAVKDSGIPPSEFYIDLMPLHAPGDKKLRAETWRALEELHAQGLLRDIGVSNFGEARLKKLEETAKVALCVNLIELHPWLTLRTATSMVCSRQEVINSPTQWLGLLPRS
ncbi:TPA: hypothetical protein N0F65_007594, partial [Lagenidium giganteum]